MLRTWNKRFDGGKSHYEVTCEECFKWMQYHLDYTLYKKNMWKESYEKLDNQVWEWKIEYKNSRRVRDWDDDIDNKEI